VSSAKINQVDAVGAFGLSTIPLVSCGSEKKSLAPKTDTDSKLERENFGWYVFSSMLTKKVRLLGEEYSREIAIQLLVRASNCGTPK
jgi:hypothetical protein